MEKQKVEYRFVKASAKEAPFSNGGEVIRVSVLVDDLIRMQEDNPDLHSKGYVNIELRKKKVADQYGNSHMVIESTFKPKAPGAKKEEKVVIEAVDRRNIQPQAPLPPDTGVDDSLPF